MGARQSAPWRVIYIAHGEGQARQIENLLTEAGFLVERKRLEDDSARTEDIEIKVLGSEAEEARLYLLEQGL